MKKIKNSKEPLLLFKHDRQIAFLNNACAKLLSADTQKPFVVIYRVTQENKFYIKMVDISVANSQEAPVIHYNVEEECYCFFSLSTQYLFFCSHLDENNDHIFKITPTDNNEFLLCVK